MPGYGVPQNTAGVGTRGHCPALDLIVANAARCASVAIKPKKWFCVFGEQNTVSNRDGTFSCVAGTFDRRADGLNTLSGGQILTTRFPQLDSPLCASRRPNLRDRRLHWGVIGVRQKRASLQVRRKRALGNISTILQIPTDLPKVIGHLPPARSPRHGRQSRLPQRVSPAP